MFNYQEHRMIRNPPLSTGGFGAIYAYQPKNAKGKQWVVKEVYCKESSQIQSFCQEVVLSFNHNSPFILSSSGFNIVQNQEGKWIIRIKMPRMKQSLRDYIINPNNRSFTIAEVVKLLYRLAYGLKQLQNVKISHRDLKPDNILLDDNNDPYLADLGLARLVVEETEYSQINLAGTPGYFPPETNHAKVTKKKDLYKIDLWNLGIIMYEVCTFKDFYLKHGMEKKKHLGDQLKMIFDAVTAKYGKKFCEIIEGLLCADPNQRISFETVLETLEKNFPEHLESTFDVLADNIKKSHQKVIIDRLSKSAEVRDLAKEEQEIEKKNAIYNANIYKERFRFAQNLASQYGKDFVFDIDEELAIKPRDPSNITSSAIENLNRGLSEILNEAPADLVSSLKVDLSWCESLNENSLKLNFKDLKKGNNIQKLTLNFVGCSQITDNGLNFLNHDNLGGLTKLKNLNLDFSGCQWIKKSGLEQLFGNLKTLSLKGLSIRVHECSGMILEPDEVHNFSESIIGITSLEKLRLDISSNSKMPKQIRNSLRQSLDHIKDLDII